MIKEPVVAMSMAGLAVGVIANRVGGLEPDVCLILSAIVAAAARRWVVPYIPGDILETFDRLSKGTDVEDAIIVPKGDYERMRIVYRQAMR